MRPGSRGRASRWADVRVACMLATCAVACTERSGTATLPSNANTVSLDFVAVSNTNPVVGDTVVVSGRTQLASGLTAASFLAAMRFDSTALRYIGASALSGMRVTNVVHDTVLAAGASTQGFDDPWLFAAYFVVLKRAPFESLDLRLRELNTTEFKNVSQTLQPSPVRLGRPDGLNAASFRPRATTRCCQTP